MIEVLIFTAPWCAACKGAKPNIISACNETRAPYRFIDLSVDEDTAIEYNVYALPTVVVLKDGEEAGRADSGVSKALVVSLIRGAKED